MANSRVIKVLIVDDAETTNTLLRGLVLHVFTSRQMRVQILQAYDGRQALDILSKQSIDLAFLDIELPDSNGLKLLQQINRQFKSCKSIVVSANGTRENVVAAISKGALGFVVKPFNQARINEAVANFIKQYEATAKPQATHAQTPCNNNPTKKTRKYK